MFVFPFRLFRVFRGSFSVCCLSSAVLLCAASPIVKAQIQAGAARVSITPDVKASAIPLGGYAARRGAPSSGVHDPVYARALVLSSGATKAALVSLDLCFLPANVKAEVAKRLVLNGATGLDAAHLFLSATHTHCAPDPLAMHSGNTFTKLKGWTPFDPALLAFTADRIAQSIIEADKARVPVTLSSAEQDEPGANRNRRNDPVVDPALTVLRVQNTATGGTLACVVDFAAHPTLYDDKMMQVSADWPGVMCAEVEKKYTAANNPAPVCLFLNGAEGDASPNGVDAVKTGEEKVTAYGQRMSKLALAALDTAGSPSKDGAAAGEQPNTESGKIPPESQAVTSSGKLLEDQTLAMWTQAVILPPRKPNGLYLLAAMQLGATMPEARDLVNALMPTQTQITFLRAGGLLMIGFPCEPSGEIGLAAKKMAREAGCKLPAVVALTNDWLAYCLTPEQYKAGKYEAVMSFYGEPFGPAMLAGVKAGLAAGSIQSHRL